MRVKEREGRRRKSLGTNAAAARAPVLPSLAHAILSTRCSRDGYDNGRPRSARTWASSFTPGTANGRCIFQQHAAHGSKLLSPLDRRAGLFRFFYFLPFLSFFCCLSSLRHDGYSIRDVRVFALHPPPLLCFSILIRDASYSPVLDSGRLWCSRMRFTFLSLLFAG